MSIATEIQRLQQAKADIKSAIEEKGVTVGDGTIDTFASKISEISAGGGDIDALIDKSITEITSNAESIGEYAFRSCLSLKTTSFPLATSIGNNAFYSCSLLETADFPLATSIGNTAFYNCSLLGTVNLPLVTSINGSAFESCKALETVDFPLVTYIGNTAFYGCEALSILIIRSETICTLSNKNAFSRTPIASGGGYIYVPRALVESYKSATNWSTYATQFRALEDYTVDGTVTGELDESKI